jgi:2-oxoglutarate ferredoxin oxidoreductase subunit alpha
MTVKSRNSARKFLQGNDACVRGALHAGCRFYAGYPITPSSEIMEGMARELPKREGVFIQMEDEISSIGAMIGAAWAGAKAMTATSGPGFSLMMENFGYAAMTETPCVIVDVQRAGPATGQATKPGSGDVMQARWGSHGDFEIIALSPWSVQEMYELTVRAFNLSETYRCPVVLLSDEAVGHLRETAELSDDLPVVQRPERTDQPPFADPSTNITTPMPRFGTGRKILVTGSTHNEFGVRKTQDPEIQRRLVERICGKITSRRVEICDTEGHFLNDCEVLVFAYGFTARAVLRAVNILRMSGRKVGLLRPKTLWPFPSQDIESLPPGVRSIVVPEMNRGQLVREVERFTDRPVSALAKTNGEVFHPDEIVRAVEAAWPSGS